MEKRLALDEDDSRYLNRGNRPPRSASSWEKGEKVAKSKIIGDNSLWFCFERTGFSSRINLYGNMYKARMWNELEAHCEIYSINFA